METLLKDTSISATSKPNSALEKQEKWVPVQFWTDEKGVEDAVLVAIPCLNEEAHIEGLVRDLLKHNRDLKMRVVIVDGGSTDRTREIAMDLASQHDNVFYLHNPRRIQSAAINLAVERYGEGAKYVIRLDAHADYPADYCRKLVAEQQVTGAASVVVSMNTVGDGYFQRAVAAAQNSKIGNGGAAHRSVSGPGAWVDHGHHALMCIDAFRSVGGYDATFSHNEDAELDLRLAKAGHKIWLTARTALDYFPRPSPRPLFKQYYNFGHGRAKTILKHAIVPKVRQMIPAAVLPALLFAALSPLTLLAAIPVLSWACLCLAYGAYLRFRARDAAIVLSGPAAMIMHLAWSIGFWRAMVGRLVRSTRRAEQQHALVS